MRVISNLPSFFFRVTANPATPIFRSRCRVSSKGKWLVARLVPVENTENFSILTEHLSKSGRQNEKAPR
ncbi:hypothetical protein BMW22_17140 [Rhizobium leguminosarum]|uniref:Uncharacterized protein n=1 Tax=Rhizobium leguminosarum TaxID=384 RepID=A0A1L3ZBT2_RHILE|nr:hypothetical protein BMW22_17140 [Rhizobium leguminosarum]